MTETDRNQLSSSQRLLLALKQARLQLEASEQQKNEPIAIVGMDCRFPGGANDPNAYWQLLQNGRDAVTEIPSQRWNVDAYYDPNPEAQGKMYTRYGGFIEQVDQFDPQFFGISPREAISLDPQQRLLLEVSYTALEQAGQSPEQLKGTQTGVFIGINFDDYARRSVTSGDPTLIDAYSSLGNTRSIAVGRIAYVLGLQGPVIQLDTTCSSSLLAVHLACQSLRAKECNLALAGGVNLMLSPEPMIGFCKLKALASDGRCKTFDESADGYGRGEGCGIVVLKRLSDAIANHDNILSLIIGSAVNHDGQSNGLTAPNGSAQEAVIRQALLNAKVEPAQIQYVETHGTGTSLGDPIEVLALSKVLGEDRTKDNLLKIGSVKTNFGHLEAAAGVASLIKVTLSLQNQQIPPHIHFKNPNPYIPWQKLPVIVPTQLTPWLSSKGKRLAGISSFGMSGTNVHLILSEADKEGEKAPIERPLHLLTLSAKNEQALQELAQNYQKFFLNSTDVSLGDVCFTANTGRSHFEHRLALVAETPTQIGEQLAAFMQNLHNFTGFKGIVSPQKVPKIAFLFTGQGSQYVGMAQELYQTQPTFRRTFDRCAEILQTYLNQPLLEILDHNTFLDETAYTQPALFAVEYSLAQLWMSWGIMPSVVMGHSVGEYVAACIAGVFSLEDGLKLVAYRGRLMQELPKNGAMVAVMASQEKVKSIINFDQESIIIAAINSPQNIVISGQSKALEKVIIELEKEGIKTTRLNVSHAFHSPLMEPMLADFATVTQSVSYSLPKLSLISNVFGTIAGDEIATPDYWCRHVCQPVQFAEGIITLIKENCKIFLEIGTKPILLGMGQAVLESQNQKDYLLLPSLKFGQSDWRTLLSSLGSLYANGVQVDWLAFEQDYPFYRISLPTYPFQRQQYWLDFPEQQASFDKSKNQHPLLGKKVNLAGSSVLHFENQISQDLPNFLKDHCVFERVIFPAAGFLEMALAAGRVIFPQEEFILESVSIPQALVLPSEESKTVQLKLISESSEKYNFEIYSLTTQNQNQNWTLHATGKIISQKPNFISSHVELEDKQKQTVPENSAKNYYHQCRERGINYGKSFQVIKYLWRDQGKAIAKIQLLETLDNYQIHPLLIDACLQVAGATLSDEISQNTYLPVGVERFIIYPSNQTAKSDIFYIYAQIRQEKDRNNQKLKVDIQLLTEDRNIIAILEGLQLKSANSTSVLGTQEKSWQDWLYQVEWRVKTENKLKSSDFLLSPKAIYEHLGIKLNQLTSQSDIKAYLKVLPDLETASLDYIVEAFWQLGWKFKPKDRFSTKQLAQQLGIIKRHHRLVNRLLEILAEEGLLKPFNEDWEVIQSLASFQQDSFQKTLDSIAAAEVNLLQQCGSNLAGVLKGECDPIQLLFKDGDLSATTRLYQESPGAKLMNTLVQEAVLKAIEKKPTDCQVKILEIGAGTGGTTSYLLPHLHPKQIEYTFTDISPLFTTKAHNKFKDYSFINYRVLDIEKEPKLQGLNLHDYDIIVCANVIHATQDLKETLAHIKQLLASEGLLILLEGTRPLRWLDLIFGLTEGWWRFTDTHLRPSHPLLSTQQWQKLLKASGFKDSVAVSLEQSVIVAQNEVITPEKATKNWLIFADAQGIAQQLDKQLTDKGETCNLVFSGQNCQEIDEKKYYINPTQLQDFQQLFKTQKFDRILYLWSLDAPESKTLNSQKLAISSKIICESVLYLVQSLLKQGSDLPPLWLVTRGSVSIKNDDNLSGIVQSSLWGLGKAIALEHPELSYRCIDLDPNVHSIEQVQTLLTEIQLDTLETQIALRDSQRYVPRLTRYQPLEKTQNEPVQLTVSQRGTLEDLQWQPLTRRLPKTGEVELKIRSTGLNFRDLLNALGLYPGDSGLLGCECSGEIVTVGAGVRNLKVGQEVIALAQGSFSQYVTVNAAMVVPKPRLLTFEESATIPAAFLTAYYTLHHLAKIKKGDRILIHAAAGGVGLAAIQIAQKAGAEVLATAHPSKWDTLKSWGVKHIMNSRTLDFADEVMSITQGEGVDIVLNSLSGEFISKSVSVLKKQGRFIEIGKRDVWTTEQVYKLKPDVSYFLVDLMTIAQQQPELINQMLKALMEQFEAQSLNPLPHQVFPLEKTVKAFQKMQHGKHIGKLVISYPQPLEFTPQQTYLITGGLGGLGLLVARWLVEKGIRHLVLVGRSEPNSSALEILDYLKQKGANIIVKKADVAHYEQLSKIIRDLETSMPPLRGVIHAAGILDDGIIEQLDWERFKKVMAPKVQGAWNLHTLTLDKPLECFILFSSATALLGSPGQANHVAANTFLDTLAHYRKSQGLPALSINWGTWSELGAAAQRGVKIKGIDDISPQNGLEIFEKLIQSSLFCSSQVGVVPINWQLLLEKGTPSPFFSDFSQQTEQKEQENSELLEQLKSLLPEERQTYLIAHIRSQVAKVLGFNPSEIDRQKGFFDLGMDSLTSVELKNRLQNSLGCSLPSTVAFDYPTVEALADYVLKDVLNLNIQNDENELPVNTDVLAELSEDDIADLLAQELLEIERGKKS